MRIDYNTTKEIVQNYYNESFNQRYTHGMSVYNAINKAEDEISRLAVNPYTGKGELDPQAIKDFIQELQGGVSA